MLLQLILSMLLGLVSPSTTTNTTNSRQSDAMSQSQTEPILGGDTGQNPPPK